MGIRYYAYPVRASDIEFARANPRDFLAADPLADAWGPAELKPRMLYLDKCWGQLQEFLGPRPDRPERVAYQLVEGQVTHTSEGWIPFTRVLDPAQVHEIADELSQIGEVDVLAARVRTFRRDGLVNDDPDELRYVMHYLNDAKSFVDALAEDDLGLIYTIG
ncbi:MAG: hypothetical protein JWP19_1329 [Rhodoglobus sp.]|nr:hypothetical protein [Rhodoglobus sp.]